MSQTDFTATMKRVLSSHKPDETQVDVPFLLNIVQSVLFGDRESCSDIKPQAAEEKCLDKVPDVIRKLYCELACNCSGENLEERTAAFLEKYLSIYSWEAKMAITVAAFAAVYGEFRILEINSSHQVVVNQLLLRKIQNIGKAAKSIKEKVKNIVVAMELINCVPEFYGYRSTGMTDHLAEAAFWVIRYVVAYATYIGAIMLDIKSTITTMEKELSVSAQKIDDCLKRLLNVIDSLKPEKEVQNKSMKNFNTFQSLFEVTDDNQISIMIGSNNQEVVNFTELGTNVVLLISSCHANRKEILALVQYYENHMKGTYKIVWFPVDYMPCEEKNYSLLQSLMPWYTITVQQLPFIKSRFIDFIKEQWNCSTQQTILIPFHIAGIKPKSYPLFRLWLCENVEQLFTVSTGDETLAPWLQKPQLTLNLLLNGIVTDITVKAGSIICLYGGEDIEWIKGFHNLINVVRPIGKLEISLNYVSRSNAFDYENQAIFEFIKTNKYGGYLTAENINSWIFWERLQCTFITGLRFGKYPRNHNVMKEIITLLGFNANFRGWALFGSSDSKLVTASGRILTEVLTNRENWINDRIGSADSFLSQLNTQIGRNNPETHHCNHIILPAAAVANIEIDDEIMACATCERRMGRSVMYHCCV